MRIPDPPWHPLPHKPTRQPLSQDLIVATALAVLEQEGLDALSMRRVAQALQTGAASLYAHVRSRDELCELLLDRVLGEVPVPEPDPGCWRDQLKDLCRAQVRAMTSYPGIAQVVRNPVVPVGPNTLRHSEAILAILRAGGLSERQAAFALDALSLYGKAYALEVGARGSADPDGDEHRLGEYVRSLSCDGFPHLLAAGPLLCAETAADRFDFALDLFIAGLGAAAS